MCPRTVCGTPIECCEADHQAEKECQNPGMLHLKDRLLLLKLAVRESVMTF
jgi:hypothetical protein